MKRAHVAVLVAAASVVAGGCADSDSESTEATATTTTAAPAEEQRATPRLALSYDGGILVLDAASLEQVADIPLDGFVRLNAAGDGRHAFVSESDGFRVLDLGSWTEDHGDHGHHYTTAPALTDTEFGGAKPGHVVVHDELVTLFSDGTGEVDILDPDDLPSASAESFTRPPHHGVAVARTDGTVVVSVGTEEERTGVAILDSQHAEVASNDQCPGIHGEAAAANGVLAFGCEDGLLIVSGNDIRKVASPDPYGRIGNQAGADESSIVLGDYKTDRDAELERPNRFTLTDTATGELRVVPFPASYSFRSLERGPNGAAVILGTDGALYVYDPVTAAEVQRIPVIDAWTEPDEWQSPMPNVFVQGTTAYVSDPTAKTISAVDLASGTTRKAALPESTIELTGVSG